MIIKKLNQRSHKEGSNHSTNTGNSRYLCKCSAGKEEASYTQNYAYQITANTDILELAQFPFAG